MKNRKMQTSPDKRKTVNDAQAIRCVAGILVGGRSRRMGRPKLSLPLPGGKTLIEHVADAVARAQPWIEEVLLLGLSPELPGPVAGLRILPDVEACAGPLAGLCALLAYAQQRWSLLLACDMPLLEPRLLERLRAAASPDVDAIAFRRPDRPDAWDACCALYHPRILPAAMKALKGGGGLQDLIRSVRVVTLTPSSAERRMLSNVNTLSDYQALVRRL